MTHLSGMNNHLVGRLGIDGDCNTLIVTPHYAEKKIAVLIWKEGERAIASLSA